MNIALFGGTFDPPHLGHTKLVTEVLAQQLFDEVWYLPVFLHQQRFAKDEMSSWENRLAMLHLVEQKGTRICEFEKTSGKPSFTHLALRELSHQSPADKFSWLMGSDQLTSLSLWKCELHETCFPACSDEFDYYVYPRTGFAMSLPYQNLKVVKNVAPMELSSTQIRNLVKTNKPIKGLVDGKVVSYIEAKKLYQD